jgi:hypothetical protein
MLDASSPGSMTESSVGPPQAFEVCMDHFIHEQNLAHYRKVFVRDDRSDEAANRVEAARR